MTRFLPLVLALLAVMLVAASGIVGASLDRTPLAFLGFGLFLDRYPIFVFAIVYGAARIVLAGVSAQGRVPLRVVLTPIALLLFLAACLYPTFGGIVLRVGFLVGSFGFLNNIPMALAYALGAMVSGLVFASAMGLGVLLARARLRQGNPAAGALYSLVAIVFGALVLAAPRALGGDPLGGWPLVPMSTAAAMLGGLILLVALLPHAALAAGRDRVSLRRP